ncbi:phosphoenolpyruvate carboxylase, partial [Candidatus Gottesmanbacteria bacterium]|nr:phosphoenolpyruvate carboxylase [Candidatus Gottesmanbacteria bacterium]
MRKIPTTMATQHPDNAGKPYWQSSAFISTLAELKECYLCFSDLGMDEYNWDWEGKFVDEAVVDRLLSKYYNYFKKNPLGIEKFLTFRIPNPRVEKQFRLARAFMVMITSSQLAQSLGFNHPPIFETILPLTETAEEIIDIQEAFQEIVGIEHRLLKMNDSIKSIEIIPLFEQVDVIVRSSKILREYFKLHKAKFGKFPTYIRPYCARSDPALNSSLIPTMLALKIALSQFSDLENETGVRLFPMVGTGTLPFRGSVSPLNIQDVLNEYRGIKTMIIQSAFRYDFPKKKVQAAIKVLKQKLPKGVADHIDTRTKNKLLEIIPFFEIPYRETVEKLAPLINSMSLFVAKRRERVQHIGLFGYSRGVGKVHLPRAISFTASLYSLGIPPEIIATGRGLKRAKKIGLTEEIFRYYVNLKKDIIKA